MAEFREFTNPLSANYDIKTAVKAESKEVISIAKNNEPFKKEEDNTQSLPDDTSVGKEYVEEDNTQSLPDDTSTDKEDLKEEPPQELPRDTKN